MVGKTSPISLGNSSLVFKLSISFIIFWSLTSIFAPIIANQDAIIPYLPSAIDLNSTNPLAPFSNNTSHWLGTDDLGRDVLSNLIYGSRTAFLVGFGAVTLAAIIGILLGSIAAIFGDDALKMRKKRLISLSISTILFIVVASFLPWQYYSAIYNLLMLLVLLTITTLVFLLLRLLSNKLYRSSSIVNIPVDLLTGRLIEVLDSLPVLFILVVLAAFVEPSISSTILIIGLTGWAGIAKFTRSEILKIKGKEYIESAEALGLNKSRILINHLLPNALQPVIITLAFGVSTAVLIESTLSFIGLGINSETASWGKLLAEARNNYSAWWLALFPGLLIFLTVISCNVIGEKLSK